MQQERKTKPIKLKGMLLVDNKEKLGTLVVLFQFAFIMVIRQTMFSSVETSGVWEWFLFSVLFLGILPIFTIGYFLRQRLGDFNIGWKGLPKRNWLQLALLLFILLAGHLLVVVRLDWTQIFQVFRWVTGGLWVTLFIDIFLLTSVVLSMEIFFRGYMMETLKRSWGQLPAMMVQAVAAVVYAYISVSAQSPEKVVYLIFLNIILGFIATVGRSVLVSALVHWFLLLALDIYSLQYISVN